MVDAIECTLRITRLTPISTQQHIHNKQGWDYDKEPAS